MLQAGAIVLTVAAPYLRKHWGPSSKEEEEEEEDRGAGLMLS